MGGNYSLPAPDPDQEFFALLFSQPNKIKLVLSSDQVANVVKNSCMNVWAKDEVHFGDYLAKFTGDPFVPSPSFEFSCKVRKLAIHILENLYAAGWRMTMTSDLTQFKDLSTWFFKKFDLATDFVPAPICCISLVRSNILQLVGGDVRLKTLLLDAIQLFEGRKAYADQGEGSYADCCEIKLTGSTWYIESITDSLTGLRIILEIIRKFDGYGWKLYGVGDLSGTSDSLFFIKDQTPGYYPTTKYFMISMNYYNLITLIECPDEIAHITKSVISEFWQVAESRVLAAEKSWQFQVKGTPWQCEGIDATNGCAMMVSLFSRLLQEGWCVSAAFHPERKSNTRAVFVLSSCTKMTGTPHFCLKLIGSQKIRLINASLEIEKSVKNSIKKSWPDGLFQEQCHKVYGYPEMTINGYPWSPLSADESLLTRAMMCEILDSLYKFGLTIIASANVTSSEENTRDISSLFFAKTCIGMEERQLAPVQPSAPAQEEEKTIDQPMTPSAPPYEYSEVPDSPPPTYDAAMKLYER